jgi:CRISPR-associated protein Cas1
VGDISITSVLIEKCVKYGISLCLLKNNLELYAEIASRAEGNYLLRDKQYKNSPEGELDLAKCVVRNKINNQLVLLRMEKKADAAIKGVENEVVAKIETVKDGQELLGIEGNMTKIFFQLYFSDLGWRRRMPRTKFDPYNVLLDIGYTFLFNYVDALLRLYGFDTYKGFYHKLFFQRKSLTCDIVEPLRCIIDRQLLKSFNLKQINERDFKVMSGRYVLEYSKSQKYAEIFLGAITNRKEEIFSYVKDFYRHIMNEEKKRADFSYKIVD